MAEGEEAELLLVAALRFEVADANGFVELRVELRSAGVVHSFSFVGCARAYVVPGWWFKFKPQYFTSQVFIAEYYAQSSAPLHRTYHPSQTQKRDTEKPRSTNTSHHRALPNQQLKLQL